MIRKCEEVKEDCAREELCRVIGAVSIMGKIRVGVSIDTGKPSSRRDG